MSSRALNVDPALEVVYASLTKEDVSALKAGPRLLFLVGNGAALAQFFFCSWVLDFNAQSILDIAWPVFLLLAAVSNVCWALMLAVAHRSAKRGRKAVVSGAIVQIEDGPADDETPVKLVHIGGERFRVPVGELGEVRPGQLIRLHYFFEKKLSFERLLRVELGFGRPRNEELHEQPTV